MNELAAQSATGTNESFDRTQLAKEYEQLKREINDISEQTTFNNMKLLDGSLSAKGLQRSDYASGVYKTFQSSVPEILPTGIKNITLTQGTPYFTGVTPDLSTAATSAYSTFDFDYKAMSSGETLKIGEQTYVFYNSLTDGQSQVDGAFMLDLAQITTASALADAIDRHNSAADSQISPQAKISATANGSSIIINYSGNGASSGAYVNDSIGGIYGPNSTKYVAVSVGYTNIPKAMPGAVVPADGAAYATQALAENGAILLADVGAVAGVRGATNYPINVGGLKNIYCVSGVVNSTGDIVAGFSLNINNLPSYSTAIPAGKLEIDIGGYKFANVVPINDSRTRGSIINGFYALTIPGDPKGTNVRAFFNIDGHYFTARGGKDYFGGYEPLDFIYVGTDLSNISLQTSFPPGLEERLKEVLPNITAKFGNHSYKLDVYKIDTNIRMAGSAAYTRFEFDPASVTSGDSFNLGGQKFTFCNVGVDDAAITGNKININNAKDADGLVSIINAAQASVPSEDKLKAFVSDKHIYVYYNGTGGQAGTKVGAEGNPKVFITSDIATLAQDPNNPSTLLPRPENPPTPPVNPPTPPVMPPVDPPITPSSPSASAPQVPVPGAQTQNVPLGVTAFELDASKMKAGDKISYLADDGAWRTHTFKKGQKEADIMHTFGVSKIAQGNEWRLSTNIDQRYRLKFEPTVMRSVTSPLKIQVGALEGQQLAIKIDAMNTTGLKLDDSDIYTQTNAGHAITATRGAINAVSEQRAYLGAMQNRLNHKTANLNVSIENLQQAESRIRDIDVALEMSNFNKNNVLAQAVTAILAQANSAPQNVLSLLR